MKNFRVNIILDAKDLADFQETYLDCELLSYDTWNELAYEVDYTKMELFNDDNKTVIVAGDTTHDNIHSVIYNFIQGMNYISTEDFIIEYGFKVINEKTLYTVRTEYFKKGE